MPKPINLTETFKRDLEALTRTRNELRLQLNADVRADWKRFESNDTVQELGASVRTLLDGLKQGCSRMRSELNDVSIRA